MTVASPDPLPSYAEVRAGYAGRGLSEASSSSILVQAEQAWVKTDPTVRMEHSSDLRALPAAGSSRIFNVFGAYRWRDDHSLYVLSYGIDQDAHELGVVDVESREVRWLTDADEMPIRVANGEWSVSPDGTKLAFYGIGPDAEQNGEEIYVINVDGSGLTAISLSPGQEEWLDW